MAHLWTLDPVQGWRPSPLEGEARVLPGAEGETPPRVLRRRGPDGEQWVLLAGPGSRLRVNGRALALGLRVLQDRDEILVGEGGRVFFSTERLAREEAFPGADKPTFCPRCKQEIDKDAAAVRCPQCGVWHHQTGDLPCWTYTATCALCPQPTELQTGFRWTPEEIGS